MRSAIPARARRLRRRLRRDPVGRGLARHRPAGAHRAAQPRAPRRLGCRARLRRRRGDPHPGPGRFLREVGRLRAAAAGTYAVGMAFLPDDDAGRGHAVAAVEADRRRGGPDRPRLARRPGRPRPASARPRARSCRASASCSSPRRGRTSWAWRSSGWPSACASAPSTRRRSTSRRCRRARSSTRACSPPAARAVLPRPLRRAVRLGAGPGALALLDQHLPELAAGPPVPLHRAQRRDQHRAGNRNWMRAREAQLKRPDPRRPRAALPDLHRRGPATPPPSTRCSSCCTSAAAACRTRC
jgi:hypothetical protein